MEPILAIMAAGMGSRYGGLKQIDPVDAAGNLIIDFSIYDALRAGFKRVIFIIKREIEAPFREAIGDRISRHVETAYAFQELDMLPAGCWIPPERTKPWGTTHAVLCAANEISNRPFAVINADDYYGPGAFQELYGFLTADSEENRHALVGYRLENTLTEYGSVARGVCNVDESGYLSHIVERKKIYKRGESGAFTEDDVTFTHLPKGTPVSMNCWGFKPSILGAFQKTFEENFEAGVKANPEKYEDLLPNAVQSLMSRGQGSVKVLDTPDKWFGVTYKEDKPEVIKSIAAKKAQGLYTEKLWD